MTIEGAAGLAAGIAAASIALTGWALSSVVEGLASVIVIWRFTGSRTHSETAEHTARKAVAVSFWLLAPYVAVESIHKLIAAEHPGTSVLGIVVTALSLVIMPVLGIAKHRSSDLFSVPPRAKAPRTCCAPTSLAPSWPAWPPTPGSAGGGWTRSSDSPSPRPRSGRALNLGRAKTAADSSRAAKAHHASGHGPALHPGGSPAAALTGPERRHDGEHPPPAAQSWPKPAEA